ncbi:hypothetical protein PGQ11_014894 [Apiospora arundinis]|uniref:Uncharacterized protein n=1 Tax=Apiospora arundinis TaxID=335852 RepID=A0ABR2HKZ1_9PEZI
MPTAAAPRTRRSAAAICNMIFFLTLIILIFLTLCHAAPTAAESDLPELILPRELSGTDRELPYTKINLKRHGHHSKNGTRTHSGGVAEAHQYLSIGLLGTVTTAAIVVALT